jgi:hypothetical protein
VVLEKWKPGSDVRWLATASENQFIKSKYENRMEMSMNVQEFPTLRAITDHVVNPANDRLRITVTDAPGSGGANHRYVVGGFDLSSNPSLDPDGLETESPRQVVIQFQNGPINEAGVNGLTHEVLLAIVADRLRSFQAGPFACKANACALTHIEEAQHWLQQRTVERMRRGVEGTHQV